MKVTVKEKEPEVNEKTYPYLGISTSKVIVLFTSISDGINSNGFCLYSPFHNKGYISSHWFERDFVPFTGEIVLSNS